MNVIIVVGWDKDHKPTGLYCGLVGAEAQAAADDAAESGKFVAIKKLVNPINWTPLPVSPVKTVVSGAPKPVQRKAAAAPAVAPAPETIAKLEKTISEQRAQLARQQQQGQQPKPKSPAVPPARKPATETKQAESETQENAKPAETPAAETATSETK